MASIFFMSIIGLVLIYVEFFVPGGILALIGAVALLLSVVTAFSYWPVWASVLFLMILAVLVSGVIKLAISRVAKSEGSVLSSATQEGFMAHDKESDLVGQMAEAVTDLRPAGLVMIGNKRMSAISYIGYINKGSAVKVLRHEGPDVIVKEI